MLLAFEVVMLRLEWHYSESFVRGVSLSNTNEESVKFLPFIPRTFAPIILTTKLALCFAILSAATRQRCLVFAGVHLLSTATTRATKSGNMVSLSLWYGWLISSGIALIKEVAGYKDTDFEVVGMFARSHIFPAVDQQTQTHLQQRLDQPSTSRAHDNLYSCP